MIKKSDLPECPVATTVQLIGSKWKLLIWRQLLSRPYRFNELQKSLEGISHKVLSESLNAMIRDGLIVRKDYQESPPHVEYVLSPLGSLWNQLWVLWKSGKMIINHSYKTVTKKYVLFLKLKFIYNICGKEGKVWKR